MDTTRIYHTSGQDEFFTPERCHIIEIFNMAQRPGVSIAQARIEPGITTANHLLQETDEWYYILQGTAEMYLNGKMIGNLSPGDVVDIPAGTPQFIRNTGTTDLVFLCVCVPGFRTENYLDLEK